MMQRAVIVELMFQYTLGATQTHQNYTMRPLYWSCNTHEYMNLDFSHPRNVSPCVLRLSEYHGSNKRTIWDTQVTHVGDEILIKTVHTLMKEIVSCLTVDTKATAHTQTHTEEEYHSKSKQPYCSFRHENGPHITTPTCQHDD